MELPDNSPFSPFPKIANIGKVKMSITQKIHGSNAQIYIWERRLSIEDIPVTETLEQAQARHPGKQLEISPFSDKTSTLLHVFVDLKCGSRTRWITPGDDNFGFAAFVHANKEEFISKLGLGTHFGEWAGLGINSGEGLSQKTFVLFDYWKYADKPLPPQTVTVPVLYEGAVDLAAIDQAMSDLKTNGSKLAPGFMRPEGVVVSFGDVRYKKVFDAEETKWKKGDEIAAGLKDEKRTDLAKLFELYGHLCQPARLEKLWSKDERYAVMYPKSLPNVVNDYFQDLVDEGQAIGCLDSPEDLVSMKKLISPMLYKFVRETVKL